MSVMSHENIREAIQEKVQKFMALYREGNAAGVAELYDEDGILMPPNADLVKGKPGIQAAFEGFLAMGVKALVFDIIEVDHCGDAAIEMSYYKLLGPADQVLDYGKYIVVWKLIRGEWKAHRDIFNTSMPAQA